MGLQAQNYVYEGLQYLDISYVSFYLTLFNGPAPFSVSSSLLDLTFGGPDAHATQYLEMGCTNVRRTMHVYL